MGRPVRIGDLLEAEQILDEAGDGKCPDCAAEDTRAAEYRLRTLQIAFAEGADYPE